MTANQKRQAVCDMYRTILGRNKYSQNLRNYCFKKYTDGCYYSDCSSSISYCYKEAGYGFGILNTVGMYQRLKQVPVTIKNGIIQNKEVLRLGDMLLFAGNDSCRSYAGYVGHVEMVYKIGSKITICGHGSGTPSTKDIDTYCKKRYSQSASTKLGHRGLIRVVRFIQDDGQDDPTNPKLGDRVLKNGMEGSDVKELQEGLIMLGFDCGSYGADGDFGDCTELAVTAFQTAHGCSVDGIVGEETVAALKKALEEIQPEGKTVVIVGGNCYVRSAANTDADKLGVAHSGEKYAYAGETSENGWNKITWNDRTGWVSGKYSKLEGN